MNIFERIERTAREDPGRLAFSFPDGKLTYGELWKWSGAIAAWIRDFGLLPGQPIPVYGHKSPWMPVCFLACVRAGHPYVPLDVNMPAARIGDIAAAVNSPFFFETELLPDAPEEMERITTDKLETILHYADEMEKQGEPYEVDENACCRGDDVYYIIFTSGSTGKPKGVQVTAGNLEHYLAWSETLTDRKREVFLNQAPFSFDLSVMDTYTALATGSTVACVNRDLLEDPAALLHFLKDEGVSVWVSTPSFAELCLGNPAFGEQELPTVKRFLFCGETLTGGLSKMLMERFPDAEIINTYGPTETTVCVTAVTITKEILEHENLLPVGKVKPGTGLYAVDEDGKRLPFGSKGELIITGDTVSAGYFKNEKQTRTHFFVTETGERAYRTGDLGYVTEDGQVYVSGRADSQIKMHGYRIELGDIEKNLVLLAGIKEAVVLPKKREGKIQSLAACIRQEGEEDTSYVRRKWIRQALGEVLPSYMVPKKIIFLDRFPMTGNGKLDRKRLESLL
jgi:D-alanine--poly(phosphoribitol) ligase subunit 1